MESFRAHLDSDHIAAEIRLISGERFDLVIPAGCEKFVGRFTRLATLDHRDGVIRYRAAPVARG